MNNTFIWCPSMISFMQAGVVNALGGCMELKQFSVLVEALYEAALNPEGWQGMASRIANAFEAGSCALQIRDEAAPQTALLCMTDNYDAKSINDYAAYFYACDPYVDGAMKLGVGKQILGQELIAESSFLNSEMYNDFGKRIGVCHITGAMLAVSPTALAGIGIHRAYGETQFDVQDKEVVGLLLPHLTRALQLHARINGLKRDRQIGFETLEALSVGVMVVSNTGRLLFANRLAERLLRLGQGITVSHGHLHAQIAARNPALQKAIRDASLVVTGGSVSAGGIIAMPRHEASSLSLVICPAPSGAVGNDLLGSAAIIFVNNPDDKCTPTQAALIEQFRLTPAEARLTAGLLDGEQLEECAARIGISLHTVKVQLRQVFAKTGCSRQAELIRKVLSNPVLRLCRGG